MSKRFELEKEMLYWYGQYRDSLDEVEKMATSGFAGCMIAYITLLVTVGSSHIIPVAESIGIKMIAAILMGIGALAIPAAVSAVVYIIASKEEMLAAKYDRYLDASRRLKSIDRKEEEEP